MKIEIQPEVLSIAEAAKMLRMSIATFRKLEPQHPRELRRLKGLGRARFARAGVMKLIRKLGGEQ